MILGVRHVGFVVKSIDNSRIFYEALGFVPENDGTEESGVDISNLVGINNVRIKTLKLKLKILDSINGNGCAFRLELVEYISPISFTETPQNTNNIVSKGHLCFSVNDIREATDRIIALGGNAPYKPVLDSQGIPRIIYVTDPDGVPIELNSNT